MVGLVLGEEELRRAFGAQMVGAFRFVLGDGDARRCLPDRRSLAAVPTPGVAKPQRREEMELGGVGAAVVDLDADVEIVDPVLGVLDEDVEVPILGEDAGVDQLHLAPGPALARILLDEPRVRVLGLGVLVEVLHVRMRRRGVQVVVQLLHVLAVVTLRPRQAKKAFFQDRVPAVPQGDREAEYLATVADAGEAVLVPAVGARAGLVVRKVVPGRAVRAVVLADRAPGALGEIWAPALPVLLALARFLEPHFFGSHRAASAICVSSVKRRACPSGSRASSARPRATVTGRGERNAA